MDAVDFTDKEELDEKLFLRWMGAGHEVIHERGCFRHKLYRKDFPPGTVIRRNGGLAFITSNGATLCTENVLPERGDLALDAEANVVDQDVFEKRYKEYLRWYKWVESTDISCEPIPNVNDYVSQVLDTFSDSKGYVEYGFDARKPAPDTERTHYYDHINDRMIEIAKHQETFGKAIEHLLEKSLNNTPQKPETVQPALKPLKPYQPRGEHPGGV